ncbi:bacteriophage abortive infection AbiH family protein [Shewanella sp. Isolate8]|uniref:bacteriophage abortive infection AbiH family protein n=1 Tax=Shewanella sp. Isolate8 TaxID=2908529 RepID=UPI001EFE0977|nr:bacteriophage abortive infection AbiH family protein [Shewanella sp. Isolate8]MCG9745984.1 bacteriophage abortive infection AbiH family protein [Shewanella sp. Isolate8]
MTTIVIIGNGFDLHNGLPTSYKHFQQQYHSRLDEHFAFFPEFFNDQDWSTFEENLGIFNQDEFNEQAAWQPSVEDMIESSSYLYGYEDEIVQKVDELVNDIKTSFITWVRAIDISSASQLFSFPEGSNFISFNYTPTLQNIYSIADDHVLNIHGEARTDVIFGHGIGNGNRSASMPWSENEPWFDESNRTLATVTDKLYKPVSEILERYRAQLEGYGFVEKIIVIGHSINNIDLPYFRCILEAYPDAVWENWNSADNISYTHDRLIALGVPQHQLSSASSCDLATTYPIMA